MMLHRHFNEKNSAENMTTLADVTPHEDKPYVSDIFPPAEEEAPKRRGRPKKQD